MLRLPKARACLIILVLLSGAVSADEFDLPEAVYPDLPKTAASAELFAPEGWAIESQQEGDLNADGRNDLLLVLKEQNQSNVMTNSFGGQGWDANPRILAAAFALESGGYELILQNNDILPRHADPLFCDPLRGAYIEDGTIRISLGSFATFGTWMTSSWHFVFRYQDSAFRLIAYSAFSGHRATGEFRSVREDYLARTIETTTGGFTGEKTVKEQLPASDGLMTMEEVCSGGVSMDPLGLSGQE